MLFAVAFFLTSFGLASAQSSEAAKTVGAANAQVVCLYGEGKYTEAVTLALQTLERAEKSLGKEHPDTLISVNNLAALYQAQGRHGEVLVALWNVDDEGAKEFMKTFYDRWTLQATSDPAAALQATKLYFLSHPNSNWRDPKIWAAFVLFEG